jgi:Mg/Co/Ni transporter MgtE
MNIPVYKFKTFPFNETIVSLVKTCHQYDLSHLPVVEKNIYRGMVRCHDLTKIENQNDLLKNHIHLLEKIYISDRMDWTESLSVMLRNETNVIGVLDAAGKYIGIKLLDDLLNLLTEKDFINKKGYMLVINKFTTDFSVSQVAQIIESDGGKIFGILVNENDKNTEVEVKIQTEDINEIIQNFRRYDYNIISHIEEDLHLQELKEHSEFLKRYLEMGN